MRPQFLLPLLALLLLSAAEEVIPIPLPTTFTIHTWPFSQPTPAPLFKITYDASSGRLQAQERILATGAEGNQPRWRECEEDPDRCQTPVRLGFWDQAANDQAWARRKAYMAKSPHAGTTAVERDLSGWKGILVRERDLISHHGLAQDDERGPPVIVLHLPSGRQEPLTEASVTGLALKRGEKSTRVAWDFEIETQRPDTLPTVVFDSPIPLTEDGKPIQPEKDERSFFVKYWWLFLIAALFAVTSAGGE